MTARLTARRGVTLIELMLSLIVAAIVGAALIRMSVSQARFMDQQEAWRSARSVARSGVNRLVSDIRVVEASGGLEAAAAGGQDFTLRVPYAFGILCATNGATSTLSLLPVDATMYAAAGYSGFAWRGTNGAYNYVPSAVVPTPGVAATCTAAAPLPILNGSGGVIPSINGSPVGQLVIVTGAIPNTTPPGTVFFLYRRVRYEFKASVILPGRTGLWRTTLGVGGGTEELAAPFANTARVNFFVLNNAAAQAAVPAPLSDCRGLELVLDGMSEQTPNGSAGPKTANMRTAIFFE
ncbi:MAG TPA: prepilin-type N-terminal cleavage/methylation domain-containing protein, partial [Gemmatimonadales bacterium]